MEKGEGEEERAVIERQAEGRRARGKHTRNGSDEKSKKAFNCPRTIVTSEYSSPLIFVARRHAKRPRIDVENVARRYRGQGSGSAVRLSNDNIGHTHDPPVVTLTRVSQSARLLSDNALTYLEPGAPGVYHPFASRYFAKFTGVPARFFGKKCRD